MNRLSIFKKFLLAIALGSVTLYTYADSSNDDEPLDELEMSIDENLAVPVIPSKSKSTIVTFMQYLSKSLKAADLKVEPMRNDEVLHIVMPCSDLFAPNAIELKASGKEKLSTLKSVVANPKLYKVLVAVHTDDTGDAEYADSITESRATSIDRCLFEVSGGIDTGVIPYGLGRDEPLTDNSSIELRAKNRRVEFYIIPTLALVDKLHNK
jgi:outer membrane protein OmpA-like peptidoglycan-associated protein